MLQYRAHTCSNKLHVALLNVYWAKYISLSSNEMASPMQLSITVMVAGAIIAGATDLSYSLPGYIWVAICAISTAVYLLLIRKLSDKTGKPLFRYAT